MTQKITDYMKDHIVYFDGAMGTMVQKHGLKAGENPELFSLTHPDQFFFFFDIPVYSLYNYKQKVRSVKREKPAFHHFFGFLSPFSGFSRRSGGRSFCHIRELKSVQMKQIREIHWSKLSCPLRMSISTRRKNT